MEEDGVGVYIYIYIDGGFYLSVKMEEMVKLTTNLT